MKMDAQPMGARRRSVALVALAALVTGLLPMAGVAAADIEARGTQNVCDPPFSSSFDDIAGSAHEDNVLCMADYGITEGTGDGTSYSPRREVTRAQMASFIARYIEHYTGESLPLGDGRFDDVPSVFVHHDNIHKLLAAGVTEGTAASEGESFAPQQPVTRAQMASFISRASSFIEDGQAVPEHEPPRTTADVFPDDDGSVHEPNINALAAVGIVEGFTDGTYRPGNPVFRDQMASFVMRGYDWAVAVDLGDGPADPLVPDPAPWDPDPDPEPGAVTGTVTVAGEDTPIEGATVTLANGEDHAATTAGDGSYTIDDVTAGTYTATAVAEEYVQDSREIEVEAGEMLTVNFALTQIPEQFDTEVTVQLNWQNEYRDAEEAFGGVDDYAAFHLDNDGAGEVTLKWNEDAGVLVSEGQTTVTSRIPGDGTLAGTDVHVHAGALDAEGPVELALQAPTFVGDAADEPGEADRGLFTYSLDGAVMADVDTLQTLDTALAADGLVDWYVNVHTVHNPAGEVRGQLHATAEDGGLSSIVPVFEYFEFHELGEGTITGTDQTSFNLWFDADIEFAGETGKERPQPEDFVLTRERDGQTEDLEIIRVRGDNPDWQPYPKQDIRIHLDTHDVIEDGDVVEIEMLDSGAEKLRPVGRNAGADDLSETWRTRCTVVLSVDAMTSEPCGTPDQPGLSDFEATDIDSAPHQPQEFSVTIEEPGIAPHPAGYHEDFDGEEWERYDAEPWELWIDLDEVSHEGLVDYSESEWTAEVDGEPVGTVEFWEYREVERFAVEWEPFLVFTHDEDEPLSGELVLSGTDIDGSDAAALGDDLDPEGYDTFVVRYDTGRADYTEIVVNYVPQPLISLEPADAVVLAEDGAFLEVTATYTDVDDNPVVGADIDFWVEQGERPDIVEEELGTATTDAAGQATITYEYDNRDVELGDPLIDTLHAQLVDATDPDAEFVDAETTVTWATGVATNEGPGEAEGATYHDLNDAVPDAGAGDTIIARGEFTSVYGLPRSDRAQLRTPGLTLQAHGDGASLVGAFDVRANGVTVDGFAVEQAGSMEYAFRVEGANITISNNDIDAAGADGFRVRDAWGPVDGGGSATIIGNTITDAAIGIDVDNRDQATALITSLTITGNEFVNNADAIHYNPAGGTPSITGNHFVAGETGNVYIRDATEGEVLLLEELIDTEETGNTYDPEAEILGRSIVPIDPEHVPSMVEVVEHGAGTGNMYSIIEYTRGVACDEDGAMVGSQFLLDRGTEVTPNRVGEDVECGWDGQSNLVKITWDGNPSFPNEIFYEKLDTPAYHIHNEHELDEGGYTSALSPDSVGSPFPKPEDEAPVYGAVYLNYGASTIHERWFTQGQVVSPITLRVAIASRSEVPDTGLSLWFDGARPGEEFTAGEDICADLLTPESCTLIADALADEDGFIDNTVFLDEVELEVASDAALGVWQLRFWVVDADTKEPYFSDTFDVEIIEEQPTSD